MRTLQPEFGVALLFASPLATHWSVTTPLIPIVTAVLPAGPQVATQICVPNLMSLVGSGVWLQVIQVSGSGIRASTIVGEIIH
ncbi:MAG: hypothetical protein ACI89X_003405 [Planctomycetota bacterium]|jgi:hypothetical protein